MAYRKVTLPVLKLTHRPTAGRKSSESIHRGIFSQLQNPVEPDPPPPPPRLDSPTDTATAHCSITDNLVEPTGHELESRSIVAGWDCVRSGIIGAVTEVAAIPFDSYVTFVKKLLHCDAIVVDLLAFIVLCVSRSVTVGLISFMLQRNGRYSTSSCSYSRPLLCF